MSTVLKLSTGDRSNKVLCQNESKTIHVYVEKTEQLGKLLNGRPHIFVKAKISKVKGLSILSAVKDPRWNDDSNKRSV